MVIGGIGSTLYECLQQAGHALPASCGGSGSCQECNLIIQEGEELLSRRTVPELHLGPGHRLACQARIVADSGGILCFSGTSTPQRIEDSGVGIPGPFPCFDPAVKVSCGQVLLDGIVIDKYRGGVFGVALDIGTSTVVLRVEDLETGKAIYSDSFINPQFFAGSDVISRISYASGEGLAALQQALVKQINRILKGLSIPDGTIYEMVVAGNPAMRDIFFGIDVNGLGQHPFWSLLEEEAKQGKRDSTSVSLSPSEIGVHMSLSGRIYGLPLPGSHVGADISAGVLASGLAWAEMNAVFLDLGTNSEIVVKNGDRIVTASCPAGPAFEGGQIKCGMPGVRGAVEAVRILSDNTVQVKVIGKAAPAGFCGSGLISLLGEMLEAGLVNNRGRITEGLNRSVSDPASSDPDWDSTRSRAFSVVAPPGEPKRLIMSGTEGLFLDEDDISQLLQAKAAITAGIRIALRKCGLGVEDIDRFYLAGAFGKYLSLDSASRIGILPRLEEKKFYRLGNASIEGASMALLSSVSRQELEKVVKNITHLELESEPDFSELYTDGCLLGEL